MNLLKIFSVRNIAIFFLVIMCTVYIPIDTRAGVSPFKTLFCLLAPFLILAYSLKASKMLLCSIIYLLTVIFSALFNIESFRASTLLYQILLFGVFIMYYNFVYFEKAFDIDSFITFLRRFIYAFVVVLLLQQIFILLGITQLSIINLTQVINRGIGANSLTAEPSTFARIMFVLFLALIRMYEIKWGVAKISIRELYRENKWVIWGFLWCMITMGSGTAFVLLALLSLYFLSRRYIFTVLPLIAIIYLAVPYINYTPLQRAVATIDATLTMSQTEVMEADGSAAVRVLPILNTITELDIFTKEAWIGHGTDYGSLGGAYSRTQMIGGISEYGLIAFFLSLLFIYSFCIRGLWSLESIYYIAILQMTIKNIPLWWGIFMIWTTVKYFQEQNSENKECN